MTRGVALALVAIVACGGEGAGTAAGTGTGTGPAAGTRTGAGTVVAVTGEPVIAVDDPVALAALENGGAGFRVLFDGWGAVRAMLEAAIAHEEAVDPLAGVGMRGNPHRLFDPAWLDLDVNATMSLVGLVYRVDLADAVAGTCGDVRLVYRLGYRHAALASRLPMTVALVLPLAPDATPYQPAAGDADVAALGARCRRAAAAWFPGRTLAGEELARWLADGPLAGVLSPTRVALALVNVQLSRTPSAAAPSAVTPSTCSPGSRAAAARGRRRRCR